MLVRGYAADGCGQGSSVAAAVGSGPPRAASARVTLQLLWKEHRAVHPDGGYTVHYARVQRLFMQLPNYSVYVRLMIDGAPSRPFSAVTLPP